jgi:HNH endonuclease
MAPRTGTSQVRYLDGDANTMLRDVLHRLWKSKCYSCEQPKDYTDIQIDHLIPKGLTAQELHELLEAFGLPITFDLDRPANLAPICGRCNRKKSNRTVPTATKILAMILNAAIELEPRVISAVNAAASSNQIGTWLRQVNATSLDAPRVRKAFLQEAPAIVQKLALLDPDKADFTTVESVDLDLGPLQVPVHLSLNTRGRTAITVLDEVLDRKIADAMEPGVDALISAVSARAQSAIEAIDDDSGEPFSAGPPECDQLSLTIDQIDFDRDGAELTFSFDGTFAGMLSGSVVRSSWDGDGLDELQGDSEAAGRFTFSVTWDFTKAPPGPGGASAEITEWALPHVLVWPLSYGR